MIVKNKRLDFLIKAVILAVYCAVFDYVDNLLNLQGYLFAFAKILGLIILLFSLNKKKEKVVSKFSLRYTLLILICFLLTFVLCYSQTHLDGKLLVFIKNFIFLSITIALEEFFFRSYAVNLFDEDGVISIKNAYYIAIVFVISNSPIFFFRNYDIALLTLIFSFALDVFVLGVFLSSKNIFLCLLCGLFIGGTELYFETFGVANLLYGGWVFYLIYALEILFYTSVGSIFIMRNTVRK